MNKRWLAVLALMIALGVAAPSLMADHGWDKDKGPHGKHFRDDEHGRRGERDEHRHAVRERRGDRDDVRWDRRGSYEYRSFYREDRPPGWVRGRKVAWNYCGLPPGQARKYGCWAYMYQGRRYYYYHDDDDRIVIRRPTVIIHAGVDIVQ